MIYFFFLLINVITFGIYGYDKFLAKNHKRRISEKTLLFLAFIGGTTGAMLGMIIFRHKTSKRSFLWMVGLIIVTQVISIYLWNAYR